MTSVALDLGAFPRLVFVRLNTGLEKLDGFLWSAYKETFGQRLLSFLINVTAISAMAVAASAAIRGSVNWSASLNGLLR